MGVRWIFVALLALGLGACGDDSGDAATGTGPGDGGQQGYAFGSRFVDGEGSVSHSGQAFRHLLIVDMKSYLGGLTASIDDGSFLPAAGDVTAALEFYYAFDSAVGGGEAILLSTEPTALQSVYDDLSSDKDLSGKIAGNDPIGQHVDWSAGMPGWGDGSLSPEGVVRAWFDRIDALAVDRANGVIPTDPDGAPNGAVFVTAEGQDLQQLLQKLLLGAVAFSQGVDDYLGNDTEGKGLLSDNTVAEEGAPYTALEHAWDEGFGYFGAAHDYADYSDDEVAVAGGRDDYQGYHDSDGDGAIDLGSEYNFGHSQNASKRDRGAVEATDYSQAAIDAFIAGRRIIAEADGALDDAQMRALVAERDRAVQAWDQAIAATVVHYINEVLVDMAGFGTEDYSFADHAKHWSELKGFALSLQFNPDSPIGGDFAALHDQIGDAPAREGSNGVEAYRAALLEARTLLGDAYGFADANLGDDAGVGGW